MDLSIIEKLITFITLPFQSFLTIEILLIFLLILIFLIYNEKRQNKKVKYAITALIIFFFSLLAFYFSEDIVTVLSEIVKTIMRCFYFPNIVFYILTAVISLVILIYTILKNNLTKLNKIITYVLTLIHLYLFTNFISLAITNNTSLTNRKNALPIHIKHFAIRMVLYYPKLQHLEMSMIAWLFLKLIIF